MQFSDQAKTFDLFPKCIGSLRLGKGWPSLTGEVCSCCCFCCFAIVVLRRILKFLYKATLVATSSLHLRFLKCIFNELLSTVDQNKKNYKKIYVEIVCINLTSLELDIFEILNYIFVLYTLSLVNKWRKLFKNTAVQKMQVETACGNKYLFTTALCTFQQFVSNR